MARLKKTEHPPQIRWLIRRDMPEVMEIENRCYQFPWSEEEFLTCLRERNTIGVVYESPRNLIHGFMIYELHKSLLRLLNFAVAPEVHGTGVGSAMVERLVDKLSQQKRRCMELEIRESNLKAQKFFSGRGFRAVRVLRQHYDETNEDAYLFRYSLPELKKVAVDGINRISQYDDP